MRHALSGAAVAVAVSIAGIAQAQDGSCRALAETALPGTQLTVAEVPAGPFTPPNAVGPGGLPAQQPPTDVPAFCRVTGTIAPAIRFEVWLPQKAAWNGRLQTVGGGGFAGVISYGAMLPALKSGYVTASTDTGHVAPDVEWLADKQRLVDYGYRAIHETTVGAKTLLAKYYGKPADYNYFNGCSTGGRQGLMEAQRFPDDYDGIVSGAPVNYFVAIHAQQLHIALSAHPKDDAGLLAAKDLALVNRAVLAQCDALDGVKDGVLDDPRTCDFKPRALQCAAGGSSAECLSPDQVGALEKIYAGAKNPRTGASIHPTLVPGGEPTWLLVTTPGLVPIPYDYFGRAVFGTPQWDWRKFDFDKDVALANERTGEVLNAIDPDLSKFKSGGGKLVLYHGWNDQVIFPQGSIDYQQSVADKVAPGKGVAGVQDFFRLFMVPGMAHCRGGTGTDQFDAQSAVEAWVEKGVAPASIAARRVEGGNTTRTRPLCPFPLVAKYDGSGDTNDAANFACQ